MVCDNAQGMQSALNQLAISVRRYGMCFAPSKCKVLLQDWQDSNPVLTLDGEQIDVVEKFVHLGSCTSAGGGVSDEINARIVKARAAYANLGHLWRLRDVSLAVKGRGGNAPNNRGRGGAGRGGSVPGGPGRGGGFRGK
ncbi:unnamed protein product [Schistosoma margrebowiei]|uniref:Reverse transcriptase domain-containing protein n=1 Tax=Schistosoma margrebowiei TaxID=48269 RepID=A0A3P8DJY8_9TREM|nr:unnamed protein product [Schistosoma margrebowiei]